MTGPLPLDAWQLLLAAALVLVNGGLSLWLRLGLEKKLLVASLRTVVQLSLVGLVLTPVFDLAHPVPVLLVGLVMVVLAGREAVHRSSRRWPGVQRTAFLALLIGPGFTALLATGVVIGADPWWRPQYLVPLLGMLLGNALTGISLGLDRALSMLDEGRPVVEARLSMGATWWEASRPVAADALRAGMIPILNTMSVVGLVTLPGMMTGQILSGTDPALAARYQVMIMFLIAGATALGTATAVLVSVRAAFDGQGRLKWGWIGR
ncbi:MAG: iron export ABC transporter permease subunit FetB [Alphaproteobacteria bacterium]|nr:iron export ABC transporter permease subunit FetB [Alphaproteobacteria bacterium]